MLSKEQLKQLGLEPVPMLHSGPDAVQGYLYVGDDETPLKAEDGDGIRTGTNNGEEHRSPAKGVWNS